MAKDKSNDLSFYGLDFQFRLVHAFFADPNYFKDLHSIIDQNMFTDTYLRTVVGVMVDYYEKYESVPSYSMVDIKLREKQINSNDYEIYAETLEKIKKYTTEGIEDIEASAEKFFTQQNWIRVAHEILDIAGNGDMSKYYDCQRLINEALTARRQEYRWTNPYDDILSDMSRENVIMVPTGITRLDEVLGGGLEKGNIGLIIATMGSGKTSLTTGLAAFAASYRCEANGNEGFKVMQIVFEDKNRNIHRKYFGRITNIETRLLNSNEETENRAIELLQNYPNKDVIKNNVRIYRLKSGNETVGGIERLIRHATNEGFKPDMVVIDYFECIKLEGKSTAKKHEQEEQAMRQLEILAAELDIALWLPTQGNREGISAELLTTDKIQGSISKAQVSQVVISITRSLEDSENNRATISVLKNRSGGSGNVIPVMFNNGTCTVVCDETVNFDNFNTDTYNDWVDVKETEKKEKSKKELIGELLGK